MRNRTLSGLISLSKTMKQQDDTGGDSQNKKFGTFGGVFTPNVLTILGVIMYLRLGWVVGNAGLLGAIVIILMAKSVTICTGLSMSSITTNIKIGAGGAYSIISRSLGLEVGGSIGIPLYIAQTLSAALYIIGFAEGWIRVFPEQPTGLIINSLSFLLPTGWGESLITYNATIVMIIAWISLLTISYISAHLAIKAQYIIMGVMVASIISFLMTPVPLQPVSEIPWIGNFESAGFWEVFAVFFPAVTGIMAGANMSGDLKDPRRAIPVGTMGAIALTMVVYVGLAVLIAMIALPSEMITNQMVMVDKSYWPNVVVAGIMGATLSSALGSMLGAPRILQALAEQKTVPLSRIFAAKTENNEPRNAIVFTGGIIIIALLAGDLNALASLITMFFLITYGMLNIVVFLQQTIRIISFRPSFKVPRLVSFFGGASCIFMMFFIDPIFSVVSILTIIAIYVWLVRQELEADWGDIRGGIFVALAERASRIADKFPKHHISWKPDLVVPMEDPKLWSGSLLFIKDITFPSGSLFAFTVTAENDEAQHEDVLSDVLSPLKAQNILTKSVVIQDDYFLHGARTVIQTLRGGAFRPNTLFLRVGDKSNVVDQPETESTMLNRNSLNDLVSIASKYNMGVILLRQHPQIAFGMQQDVNLWLRDKSPNWHLAMLITLQLQANWGGKINLITVARDDDSETRLQNFLEYLSAQARLPSGTAFHVLRGPFTDALTTAPRADLNIFGLSEGAIPLEFIRESSNVLKSSCLYVKDSGQENALV